MKSKETNWLLIESKFSAFNNGKYFSELYYILLKCLIIKELLPLLYLRFTSWTCLYPINHSCVTCFFYATGSPTWRHFSQQLCVYYVYCTPHITEKFVICVYCLQSRVKLFHILLIFLWEQFLILYFNFSQNSWSSFPKLQCSADCGLRIMARDQMAYLLGIWKQTNNIICYWQIYFPGSGFVKKILFGYSSIKYSK